MNRRIPKFSCTSINYKGYIMYTYSNTYDGTHYQNYDIRVCLKMEYTAVYPPNVHFHAENEVPNWNLGVSYFRTTPFFLLCQNHSPFCDQKKCLSNAFHHFWLRKNHGEFKKTNHVPMSHQFLSCSVYMCADVTPEQTKTPIAWYVLVKIIDLTKWCQIL